MKRTKTLALTGLMAVGGFSLSACGDDPNVTIDQGKAVDAFAYQSLQECKDKNDVPDSACDTAMKKADDEQKSEARYSNSQTCEDVYGPGQCVPRGANNGGSFWGPLVTGFVVGRMLDGGWGGGGMYRDWRGGGYYTRGGGPVYTDYASGRTRVGSRSFDAPDTFRAPEKMTTRSSVISRGGFGGRLSNRSYGGGGWGG